MRFLVAAILLCGATVLPAGEPAGEDPGIETIARTEAGMSAESPGVDEPGLLPNDDPGEHRRRPLPARDASFAPSVYRSG